MSHEKQVVVNALARTAKQVVANEPLWNAKQVVVMTAFAPCSQRHRTAVMPPSIAEQIGACVADVT